MGKYWAKKKAGYPGGWISGLLEGHRRPTWRPTLDRSAANSTGPFGAPDTDRAVEHSYF